MKNKRDETKIEQDLRQIADMLLLNGTLASCPGLLHGKMGIAIFFFHYAQHTDNELYENYAVDLIGLIQEQIHNNSPADFETGLAGIGAGMDFLIKNHFLGAENDIFEDFDNRMYRAVMYDPWLDFSMYDGLTGYGQYWMMRLRQQEPSGRACECLSHITEQIVEKLPSISTKEQTDVYCFLQKLHHISGFNICTALSKQCKKWNMQLTDVNLSFPRLGNSTVGNIIRKFHHSQYFNSTPQSVQMKQIPDLDMDKPPDRIGLLTGYAGEGMLRLTALNQSNTKWMQLL